MAKFYLVDSENIGASWSQLLPSMSSEDKMFVFYTEKSPYISYDNLLQVIAHCQIPIFIKCYEGKNALDFQLVSELGFRLCQEPKAEFIIVSDDYGYDAAIKYWKERSYNVHRIGKKSCKPLSPRKVEESVAVRAVAEEVVKVPETELLIMEEQEALQEAYLKQAQMEEPVAEQPVTEVSEIEPEKASDVQTQLETEAVQPENEQQQSEAQPENEQLQIEVQPEMTAEAEASTEQQDSLKENQPQKRTKERKKRHKKESVKEPEKAVELPVQEAEEVPEQSETETVTEAAEEVVYQEPLDILLLGIVNKCKSLEPMKDAFSIKEMFHSISMSNLTSVNTALKILIGNELGNDIYRELKEYQECRTLLDALYLPDAKRRFMKYVQTVLDRSELEGIAAKTIGDFLLRIPRKNLNSIRSAMIKEFGQEQGSLIYTVFKPHIKVLNNI